MTLQNNTSFSATRSNRLDQSCDFGASLNTSRVIDHFYPSGCNVDQVTNDLLGLSQIKARYLIRTIEHALNAQQCIGLMTRGEHAGFERVECDTFRKVDRVILRDPDLSSSLTAQLYDFFPNVEGFKDPYLSPVFRFYRYSKGDGMGLHVDQGYRERDDLKTLFTVLFYLNSTPRGGDTVFHMHGSGDAFLRKSPLEGDAVIFAHELPHSASPVEFGTKHVLRTDLFYQSR